MSKRKNHAPMFKAKVALAALSDEKTLSEVSSDFGVHQTLIHKWAKQLKESAPDVFSGSIKSEEALAKYGTPDIFNTDQGSQFTSFAFTNVLQAKGIRISMDGQGRWIDNVFIERLWRSLKYEEVYLHAYESGSEARLGIGRWIEFYNETRPHSKHGGKPPNECYDEMDKAA